MKKIILLIIGLVWGVIKPRIPAMVDAGVSKVFKKPEPHDPERTLREVLAEDEILEKQRDRSIRNVDDADRLFSDWSNQGKERTD